MTARDKAEVAKIAKELLSKKLIACANIFEGITSIYEWDSKLCEEGEVVAVMKSRDELFERIKDEILSIHSYENPAIVCIKVDAASEAFIQWIDRQTLNS